MKYNFFAAEFRENAGENDVGGGGGVVTRRQVKQVITLQRAMIKKVDGKNRVTPSVAARAT